MTFEEIQAMWEQDSKIDPVELDTAALSIPTLHSKYLKIFSDYKFKKKLAVLDLKQLNRRKFEYYAGRGSVEDYKKNLLISRFLNQICQCILSLTLRSKNCR